MEDRVQKSKVVKIKFTEEANELPLPYVNALFVNAGVDDFFVTIGSLVPPEIKSEEDLEKFAELTAKPLFRFATSREGMKRFIDALQHQYDNQAQAFGDEE
jgi:hypothetical protein